MLSGQLAVNVAPDVELKALARKAREEIHAARAAWSNALGHAMSAGDALIEVQPKVAARGLNWKKWLRDNCEVKPSTAQLYAQLARHRDQVEAALQDDPHLSLRAARKLISRPSTKSSNKSKADAAAETLVDHWRRCPGELSAVLDAAGVDAVLASMSPAFGAELRSRVPRQKADPVKKPTKQLMRRTRAGTDEQGAPLYAKTERRIFRH
jgi:hypothetical protein